MEINVSLCRLPDPGPRMSDICLDFIHSLHMTKKMKSTK